MNVLIKGVIIGAVVGIVYDKIVAPNLTPNVSI